MSVEIVEAENIDSDIELGSVQAEDFRIRDFRNVDTRKEARREQHFSLWLQGKKQKEISELTGWCRWTVWQDVKSVRENLSFTHKARVFNLSEALFSLRLDRAEALDQADHAEKPKDKAQFLELAAKIDLKILELFTREPLDSGESQQMADIENKAKTVIDFLFEKLGPEGLEEFSEFYKERVSRRQ